MGRIYGGRWETIEAIGEGGQAHAFRVRKLSDGSTNWILKRLKNRTRLARFEREILVLKALDSPHIVKTEDYSMGVLLFMCRQTWGWASISMPSPTL
jgi:hypothetical protein